MKDHYKYLNYVHPEEFEEFYEYSKYPDAKNKGKLCIPYTKGILYVIAKDCLGFNNLFLIKMFNNENIHAIRSLMRHTRNNLHFVNTDLNEIMDSMEYFLKQKRQKWIERL